MKKFYRLTACCLAAVLCLIPAAWGSDIHKQGIVFGIPPWGDPHELQSMYDLLMKDLSQTLGMECRVRITKDYKELSERILKKTVDVGFFTPAAYVQAKENIQGLKYLVTIQTKTESGPLRDHYSGVIIVSKSSSFNSLEDLKGKRFAFTDFRSASGYLYPRALLEKNGINPDTFFSDVYMLKKHPKVLKALELGKIDAGATYKDTAKWGHMFRIVKETAPIPYDAFAAAPHMSEDNCNAIQSQLLQLKADCPFFLKAKETGANYAGFIRRSDAFYDVVREAYLTEKKK
ncbi:phosphate/phosphite/phosphonate ABC transporter substrate-binding protein [Desulfococcaceae bacterium HSG8]|nr:phosphate/phosphite/phosphonate ABC transporter substrate-binding protein [Desulfococcaceae bacterium HSG8]